MHRKENFVLAATFFCHSVGKATVNNLVCWSSQRWIKFYMPLKNPGK
jgi:hypothetical protein